MTERSILVTGAPTGIGEACARRFDDLGWAVFAGVPGMRTAADWKTERAPVFEPFIST